MPLYEFKCLSCGKTFEDIVAVDAAGGECPVCGSASVRKLPSVFAVGRTGPANTRCAPRPAPGAG
jgi:putative FmdB family regulatory protein